MNIIRLVLLSFCVFLIASELFAQKKALMYLPFESDNKTSDTNLTVIHNLLKKKGYDVIVMSDTSISGIENTPTKFTIEVFLDVIMELNTYDVVYFDSHGATDKFSLGIPWTENCMKDYNDQDLCNRWNLFRRNYESKKINGISDGFIETSRQDFIDIGLTKEATSSRFSNSTRYRSIAVTPDFFKTTFVGEKMFKSGSIFIGEICHSFEGDFPSVMEEIGVKNYTGWEGEASNAYTNIVTLKYFYNLISSGNAQSAFETIEPHQYLTPVDKAKDWYYRNDDSIRYTSDFIFIESFAPIVMAIAGNEEVTLSWEVIENADSYNIYQYDRIQKKWLEIYSEISRLSYLFVNLTNETEYIFGVTALVSGKQSPIAKVSATPNFTDATAPTIVDVSPSENSDVPLDSNIVVTFSEPMDQMSLTLGDINTGTAVVSFFTSHGGFQGVDANVSLDSTGTILTINPVSPLEASTNYYVYIDTPAKDLALNNLESSFEFNFRTVTELDSALNGSWLNECTQHDAKSLYTIDVEQKKAELHTWSRCENPSVKYLDSYSFATTERAFDENGSEILLLLLTVESITLKPLSEQEVTGFNDRVKCGKTNWEINVEMDITGAYCSDDNWQVSSVGAVLREIYTIDGNTLSLEGGDYIKQ